MENNLESRADIWCGQLARGGGAPSILMELATCIAVAHLRLYNRENMWNTLHFMLEQRSKRG